MRDLTSFSSSFCRRADIFDILQSLNCTVVKLWGNNYCATTRSATEDKYRLTLASVGITALFATKLALGHSNSLVNL